MSGPYGQRGTAAHDLRRLIVPQGHTSDSAIALRAKLQSRYAIEPTRLGAPFDGNKPWDMLLSLRPAKDDYQLFVEAQSTDWDVEANCSFAFARALETVSTTYDGEGRVTKREFIIGSEVMREQELKWDALGRLISVQERQVTQQLMGICVIVGVGDGYDWSARYDGFDRRLETTTVIVRGGVASASTKGTFIEQSWYDPQHEFLEVAVVTSYAGGSDRHVTWKVHGPDASGSYGGFNGLGGLEASVDGDPSSGEWTAYVDDIYGHIVGLHEGEPGSATFRWHATRSSSYGPMAGSPVRALCESISPDGEVLLGDATAWRGKRQDITGFYYLGARYYESTGGRFISPDPLGHAASMSLYDYAGGDPVNFCDPDGRKPGQPDPSGVTKSKGASNGSASFSNNSGVFSYEAGGFSYESGGAAQGPGDPSHDFWAKRAMQEFGSYDVVGTWDPTTATPEPSQPQPPKPSTWSNLGNMFKDAVVNSFIQGIPGMKELSLAQELYANYQTTGSVVLAVNNVFNPAAKAFNYYTEATEGIGLHPENFARDLSDQERKVAGRMAVVHSVETVLAAAPVGRVARVTPAPAPAPIMGRHAAFNQAKRDLGIPRSQQPVRVHKDVPMTDRFNRAVIGKNGKPIRTREYEYLTKDGRRVIIQDHSAGHRFDDGGGEGPHFNVRPFEDRRHGVVEGTKPHYYFK